MKKISAMVKLTGLVLALLLTYKSTPGQQPPDNVQGNWTIYSTRIQDGAMEIKHVQIAQYGNRITGYFEGPVQAGPIQGEVDVHRIRFSTVTRNVLTFRGQIYGNNMSGTYGLHGKHAPWQAVRTTGIGAPPQVVPSYGQPMLVPPTAQSVAVNTLTVANYSQPYDYSQPSNYSQPSGYPQASAPQANSGAAPTPAPLSSEQLDSLVAPIALYPDALVAQVLAAATVPDEVIAANQWLSQNTNLTGQYLAQAVDQQDWDPSVKALTQFPNVLSNLATNLTWTSSLGQAFHFQQSDVMSAVQAMRAKAQAAGTLQSTSQITVTTPSPGVILIQPANPQVVYVPQYNPTIVYGAPIVVPMYTPPVVYAAPVLTFGLGVTFGGGGWAVGGGFGWGFHAWACNWGGWGGGGGGNTIIFNHNTYISNNTWHTANYNGYHPWANGAAGSQNHAWYGNNGTFHPDGNYKPGEDTHYGPNGGYHPNGYFGPDGGWHPDKNAGQQVPNGGNNGNHGLIGGNGGVQNPNAGSNNLSAERAGGSQQVASNRLGSSNLGAERGSDNSYGSRGWDHNRSRMSGDGAMNRAESNRGHTSMAGQRPQQQHMMRQHAPAQHHFGGGGGGRRR